MAHAYLGLGSNLGDRRATMVQAVNCLRRLGAVDAISSLYETAPVGYTNQPSFFNAVVALETSQPAGELLDEILHIEQRLGRARTFANAPRTIDIDILLYDGLVSEESELTLPHPRLHERTFVLVPLNEIVPDRQHPVFRVSIRELLERMHDPHAGIQRVAGPEWAG